MRKLCNIGNVIKDCNNPNFVITKLFDLIFIKYCLQLENNSLGTLNSLFYFFIMDFQNICFAILMNNLLSYNQSDGNKDIKDFYVFVLEFVEFSRKSVFLYELKKIIVCFT